MMIGQVAAAAAVVISILVLATGSNALLDRTNLAVEPPSGDGCLGEDGAPRNWPWPNAPTLWPKCPPGDAAAPAAPTQSK